MKKLAVLACLFLSGIAGCKDLGVGEAKHCNGLCQCKTVNQGCVCGSDKSECKCSDCECSEAGVTVQEKH